MTTDSISAMDFCLRLARANAVLIRRFDSALGTYHGISFGDFQILNHLNNAPEGKLRRIDLAERVGLSASGVTRALLPLEKIGLVTRESDPRDARVGLALITATGRELATNATEVVTLVSRELTRSAPPAQLASMAAILGAMAGIHAGNA
ncbi:MarR family winged helix-turn-helix transcriptional regulator [Massilia sp. S19_KUP03_FR1]|uniref:MarR family winged helix-turn-helix transcriptional regulator n=1 Tax=Massilia sp. S19_KUP03_FR1 TaxID=3025503 RepID=UPI002FCDDF97